VSDFETYIPESPTAFEDPLDLAEGAYEAALDLAPAAATLAVMGAGFGLMAGQHEEDQTPMETFSQKLGNIIKGLGAIILAPLAVATVGSIVGVPI